MTSPDRTRFGTFVLAARPNAGKSSLLNALIGEPLAIVSPKPQTTRLPVIGLRTTAHTQLAFVDPPGLLDPAYPLHDAMLDAAVRALTNADGVLYLHPASDGPPPPLATLLPPGSPAPRAVLTIRSKADRGVGGDDAAEGLAVSAVTGLGVEAVSSWCEAHAPFGPFRYPEDDLSTQPARFFVAEYVREAAFTALADELPYALAAEVDEFREGSEPVYIRVTLYTERESQKGIVVGAGGRTIKGIGTAARRRIEAFLGAAVYLDLRVKTLSRWRSRPDALRRFGFDPVPSRSR